MAEVDSDDLEFFINTKDKVPDRYGLESRHMFKQGLFDKWFHPPSSSKLLIHWGSSSAEPADARSSLSFLCPNLIRERPIILSDEYLLPIKWFCGRHLGPTLNNNDNKLDGGRAMMMSLIVQLLRDSGGYFKMERVSSVIDLRAIFVSSPHTDELIRLHFWLVRALPWNMKLVCIVDGVDLYGQHGLCATADLALLALLDLATDLYVNAKVNPLFTGDPDPSMMRGAFGADENLILDADMLSNPKQGSNNQ